MAGKRMYQKRFSGGSIEITRGPGLGFNAPGTSFPSQKGRPRTDKQKVATVQNTRMTFLKKKGIKPSLAHTSLEVDKPQTRDDRLMAIAARAVPNSHAESILMEQNGCALVIVVAKGKSHTVCVEIATGKIEWVEKPT